ncbi:MAG: DUF167 domain-containing protein [Planctomycetia bacterium]|nr:DUF167 domain-containing protein [Planctomycetia bacterium]
MIALESHPQGTILPVRAHAGARRNCIRGEQAGSLQVSVTQAPEKGKANKAIIAVLSDELSLRKSQFELLGGETSPNKRILVRDVAKADLTARLQRALAESGDPES